MQRVGKILVSNRTHYHAEEQLAALHRDLSFESEILDFGNFKDRLNEVDIIISSTGSDEPMLYKEDFVARDRKILVIDIAVPREVDDAVRENRNVVVKNINASVAVLNIVKDFGAACGLLAVLVGLIFKNSLLKQ